MEHRLLKVAEVARILQVTPDAVRKKIQDGKFRGIAFKIPGSTHWRFHAEAFVKWYNDQLEDD